MFSAEHALQFGLVNIFFDPGEIVGYFVFGLLILFLNRHFQKQLRLFDFSPGVFPTPDNILQLSELFLGFLGCGAVRPEIRGKRLPLKPFDFFLLGS
jgi:hypothetical protein